RARLVELGKRVSPELRGITFELVGHFAHGRLQPRYADLGRFQLALEVVDLTLQAQYLDLRQGAMLHERRRQRELLGQQLEARGDLRKPRALLAQLLVSLIDLLPERRSVRNELALA